MDTPVIIEVDEERDRKTCVRLDLNVTGANRELAQWLIDHPRYSGQIVAGWLGCQRRRIERLRVWAQEGFVGSPFAKSHASRATQSTLKSLDNSDDEIIPPSYLGYKEDDLAALANSDHKSRIAEPTSAEMESDVADPAVIEDNAIYTIQRMNEHARVFRKLFKVSSFDRETKDRISTAIDRMIQKWRSTQATLTRKGHGDG